MDKIFLSLKTLDYLGLRLKYSYNYLKYIGKNAKKENHYQCHSDDAFKLYIDQLSTGWGLAQKDTIDG